MQSHVPEGSPSPTGLAMLFGTFNRRMASRRSRRALKGSQRETAAAREDSARLSQQLDDQRTDAP